MKRFTLQANSQLQNAIYDNIRCCYTAHFMTGKPKEQILAYIEKLDKKHFK